MKRLLITLAAVGAILLAGSASATAHQQPKVGICHRTASDSNPYVFIEVAQAAVKAHIGPNAHPPKSGRYDYFASVASQCDQEVTPSATPISSPSPTFEASPTPTSYPTTEPSSEPTTEPTPSSQPSTEPSPSSTASARPSPSQGPQESNGIEESPFPSATPTSSPSATSSTVPPVARPTAPPTDAETPTSSPDGALTFIILGIVFLAVAAAGFETEHAQRRRR